MVIHGLSAEEKAKDDIFTKEVIQVKMMSELLKHELGEIKNDFNHLFRQKYNF